MKSFKFPCWNIKLCKLITGARVFRKILKSDLPCFKNLLKMSPFLKCFAKIHFSKELSRTNLKLPPSVLFCKCIKKVDVVWDRSGDETWNQWSFIASLKMILLFIRETVIRVGSHIKVKISYNPSSNSNNLHINFLDVQSLIYDPVICWPHFSPKDFARLYA